MDSDAESESLVDLEEQAEFAPIDEIQDDELDPESHKILNQNTSENIYIESRETSTNPFSDMPLDTIEEESEGATELESQQQEEQTRKELQAQQLAEQQLQEEMARQLAEQQLQEEKARQLAEQQLQEEEARQLAEQQLQEEQARQLAEQQLQEEKARQLAERQLQEEQARQLAEQQLQEEKARQLAEQQLQEEQARQLAERQLQEEQARQLAEQQLQEEEVRQLAERQLQEEKARQLAEQQLQEEEARQLAERQLQEEEARQLAEQQLQEEQTREEQQAQRLAEQQLQAEKARKEQHVLAATEHELAIKSDEPELQQIFSPLGDVPESESVSAKRFPQPKVANSPMNSAKKTEVALKRLEAATSKLTWEFDNERSTCADCFVPFSFSTRRHHCRSCGKIFCNQCCPLRYFSEKEEGSGKRKELFINGVQSLATSAESKRLCNQCNSEISLEGVSDKFNPSFLGNQQVKPLTFEDFWSAVGFYECDVIVSSFAVGNNKLAHGLIKEKLQKGLLFISGVNREKKKKEPEAGSQGGKIEKAVTTDGHRLSSVDLTVKNDDDHNDDDDDDNDEPEKVEEKPRARPPDALRYGLHAWADSQNLLESSVLKYKCRLRIYYYGGHGSFHGDKANGVEDIEVGVDSELFEDEVDFDHVRINLGLFDQKLPAGTSHLLQLFVFKAGTVTNLFLNGRMEYFFQATKIGKAIPLFLANVDYTNEYMLKLYESEFRSFMSVFGQFADLSKAQVLERVSDDKTLDTKLGVARCVRFRAYLIPEKFKKMYPWCKFFLDLVSNFSIEIQEGSSKTSGWGRRRKAISLVWSLQESSLLCEFIKADKYILYSHHDKSIEDSTREYLRSTIGSSDRVKWEAGESFFMKVNLRLNIPFLSFLNILTSNSVFFELKVLAQEKFEIKFKDIEGLVGSSFKFFFPKIIEEICNSFDFTAEIQDAPEPIEKSKSSKVSGHFGRLVVCILGTLNSSGSLGSFVVGVAMYLWTQFALTDAMFEVLHLAQELLSALAKDVAAAKQSCYKKQYEQETTLLKPDNKQPDKQWIPFVDWTRTQDHEFTVDVSDKKQTKFDGEFATLYCAQWLHRPSPSMPLVKEDVVIKFPPNQTDAARKKLLHEANMLWYAQSQGVSKFVSEFLCVVDKKVSVEWAQKLNIGYNDERIGLVLKYEPGGDLGTHLKAGLLNYFEKMEILKSISEALWYLHSAKLVHGNIAKENILLDQSKRHIRLADFKLARVAVDSPTESSKEVRMTDQLRGIAQYCAPELLPIPGEKVSILSESTYATDIYALGVIAWEVLCQKDALETFISLKTTSSATGVNAVYLNVAEVVHRANSYSCYCKTCRGCCNARCPNCGLLCGSKEMYCFLVKDLVATKCAHHDNIMSCEICYTADLKAKVDECKINQTQCECFSSKCGWHCGCATKEKPNNRLPVDDIQIIGQAGTIKNLVTKCWLTKPLGRPNAATVRDVIQKEYERVKEEYSHISINSRS